MLLNSSKKGNTVNSREKSDLRSPLYNFFDSGGGKGRQLDQLRDGGSCRVSMGVSRPTLPLPRPPKHDAVHSDGSLPVLQGGLAGQVHKLLGADDMFIVLWTEEQSRVKMEPPRCPLSCLTLCPGPAWERGWMAGQPLWRHIQGLATVNLD